MNQSLFEEKSIDFSVEIVNEAKRIVKDFQEYSMSEQMKRAGTAIGASYCEAVFAESKLDFVHKLRISLKEAHETSYWLKVLHRTHYIETDRFDQLTSMLSNLRRILIASINTSLRKIEEEKGKKK